MKTTRLSAALRILLVGGVLVDAALPLVDFDRMGKVALAGSFAGFDFFSNDSFTFDPSTSTLLSRSSSGSIQPLASTNSGGQILAGCALNDVFYFAGSFSTVGGTSAKNAASYQPSSGKFAALAGGLDGDAHAVFCDSKNGNVWFGGSFKAPVSSSGAYKGAVALFNPKSQSWSPPPFGGLAGAAGRVQSITPSTGGDSIYFSGSFITSFQSNGSSTTLNNTNNPNVPFSIGATPFSSSLVPLPLSDASIVASPSSTDAQFSNISNALCPSGADGPGNTWLAQDGQTAMITVETFMFSTASGLRLGNTHVDGKGTTAFSVITLPDNNHLTLTYIDPVTLENKTCSTSCPLSTNASIPYQDFLFNGVPQSLTGFQLTLTSFQGSGSGLHYLQLLSDGAFASSVESQNGPSCFAPQASGVTLNGAWTQKQITTSIAATTQLVQVATVNVGTPSSSAPSVTWSPYVSASGNYQINLLVPGCTNFQDCGLRTTVKVTVNPGGGLAPVTNIVSQQSTEDSQQGIYSGPIIPSAPSFQIPITMTLADQPSGSGQNGQFDMIADRVQLVLTSVNISSTTVSGSGSVSSGASSGSQRGFGFYEWNLATKDTVDATGVIPNTTETSNDALALQLYAGLGLTSSSSNIPSVVNAIAAHSSGTIFAAGSFSLSSGPANIIAFKGNRLTGLSANGLNGAVNAMAVVGNSLYVGGSFRDTASSSGNGAFRGVVLYDVAADAWHPLQAGVDGEVTSLDIANGHVDISGNFTEVLSSAGSESGTSAAGFASWSIANGTWVATGGFLEGSMSLVVNGTGSAAEFVAGSVRATRQFGSESFAMISNPAKGADEPTIQPLTVQFTGSTSSSPQRRSAWLGGIAVAKMFKRQATGQSSNLPNAPTLPSPAVLAGAFFSNSSGEIVAFGGNFSFGAFQNVALYNSDKDVISGLNGAQVDGTVRAMQVVQNSLLVGGQFALSGTSMSGFALYDLKSHSWDTSLQGLSGSSISVRSITTPPSQSNVAIVAGIFDGAGSTSCKGICRLDVSSKQWSALGQGINGQVSSVAYTNNPSTLVAAGAIQLADGTAANVASYDFGNQSWKAVGDSSQIPGQVTALEVDNGNSSSIFAAGQASDGNSMFLVFWNGNTWSRLDTTLQSSSEVAQLAMLPLQNTHNSNPIIESDRMLFISGSLTSSSFGNISSGLFDGQSFIPYLVSTSPSGGPGFISQLLHSLSAFSFSQRHFLPVGIVILISIAIATGIVFFLLLLGILWTLFARRDPDGYGLKYPPEYEEDDHLHRPSSLLEHINAATRGALATGGAAGAYAGDEQHKHADDRDRDVISPGSDTVEDAYIRPVDTPVDAAPGTLAPNEHDMARPSRVRYSFDAGGEGELPLTAGSEVQILDDRDASWWYARDPATGREGVVPASYLY